MKFSRIHSLSIPINLLAKFLSCRLSFKSTRIETDNHAPILYYREDQQTIRWMDSVNLQRDTYNITLASLGTTPLRKIIYAGRLEYGRVCVCLQVLRGKRDMWRATQGLPADEFFWLLNTGEFIYLSGTASHGRWTASHGRWTASHVRWTASHVRWTASHVRWTASHVRWTASHGRWTASQSFKI
jgi:hypothetical protein